MTSGLAIKFPNPYEWAGKGVKCLEYARDGGGGDVEALVLLVHNYTVYIFWHTAHLPFPVQNAESVL